MPGTHFVRVKRQRPWWSCVLPQVARARHVCGGAAAVCTPSEALGWSRRSWCTALDVMLCLKRRVVVVVGCLQARGRYCLRQCQYGAALLWLSRGRDGAGMDAAAAALLRGIQGHSPTGKGAAPVQRLPPSSGSGVVATQGPQPVRRAGYFVMELLCVLTVVADALALLDCTKALYTQDTLRLSPQLQFVILYVRSSVDLSIVALPSLWWGGCQVAESSSKSALKPFYCIFRCTCACGCCCSCGMLLVIGSSLVVVWPLACAEGVRRRVVTSGCAAGRISGSRWRGGAGQQGVVVPAAGRDVCVRHGRGWRSAAAALAGAVDHRGREWAVVQPHPTAVLRRASGDPRRVRGDELSTAAIATTTHTCTHTSSRAYTNSLPLDDRNSHRSDRLMWSFIAQGVAVPTELSILAAKRSGGFLKAPTPLFSVRIAVIDVHSSWIRRNGVVFASLLSRRVLRRNYGGICSVPLLPQRVSSRCRSTWKFALFRVDGHCQGGFRFSQKPQINVRRGHFCECFA